MPKFFIRDRTVVEAIRRGDSREVTVTTSETVIINLDPSLVSVVESRSIYRVFLKNTGAIAINSCIIQAHNSISGSGTWKAIASTASHYTNIPRQIQGTLRSSDDAVSPTTLATGQEWNGSIDGLSFANIRMVMTVASGSTTVLVEVS